MYELMDDEVKSGGCHFGILWPKTYRDYTQMYMYTGAEYEITLITTLSLICNVPRLYLSLKLGTSERKCLQQWIWKLNI